MKIVQPAARHIPCAYWIPGDEELHYTRAFLDDGEPGSGRILLNTLLDLQLPGHVIFGVRKYGGLKIGADRFLCYWMAAYSALGHDPEIYESKQRSSHEQRKKKRDQQSYKQPMGPRDSSQDSSHHEADNQTTAPKVPYQRQQRYGYNRSYNPEGAEVPRTNTDQSQTSANTTARPGALPMLGEVHAPNSIHHI